MNRSLLAFAVALSLCLVGCGAMNSNSMTTEEASAVRDAMMQTYVQSGARQPSMLPILDWVQPHNKREACLVSTFGNTLDDESLTIYWDGACQGGYASGVGRVLMLSPSRHEEIIQNAITPQQMKGKTIAYVVRDFVEKQTIQAMIAMPLNGASQAEKSAVIEERLVEAPDGVFYRDIYAEAFMQPELGYYWRTDTLNPLSYIECVEDKGVRSWHLHYPTKQNSDIQDVYFVSPSLEQFDNIPMQARLAYGKVINVIHREGGYSFLNIMSLGDPWSELHQSFAKAVKAQTFDFKACEQLTSQYRRLLRDKKNTKPRGLKEDVYLQTLRYYADFFERERHVQEHLAALEPHERSYQSRQELRSEKSQKEIKASSPSMTNCFSVGNMMHCNTF